MPCYPFSASQMTIERPSRPIRMVIWINVQYDPRDLAPVCTFGISIEHPHIGDSVLLIVVGECWTRRRVIGDIGVERPHGMHLMCVLPLPILRSDRVAQVTVSDPRRAAPKHTA
jgi:hypothetical protein